MPFVQSKIHSDCDSAESIADSDLEDGELRKMLASPLHVQYMGEEKNCGSSQNRTASGKPEAKVIQKRGASARRTQADHSRRESLMCHVRLGNRMQCFYQGVTNRETGSSSIFNVLIHQNWEDHFLKVIKIICSDRQDLIL